MNTDQLSRTALCWQLLSIFAVFLPHLSHLPIWVPALVVVCVGWRFMVYLGRWSYPKSWVKTLLVLLMTVAVLSSYRAGAGISVTVTLLVVGFALKALEMNQRRDALVVLYVAYLVASTAFLFSQTILMALYIFLALTVCTTALLTIHSRRDISFLQPFKRTLWLLLPALPLMVVLFVVMPRLAPLWEVGLDRSAAKTGLSDQMSPGDITQLTRSAEVAFRATFDGPPPQQTELYWRALVFNDFDGRTWLNQAGVAATPRDVPPVEGIAVGATIDYELILEANLKRYIPVLEQVTAWPTELFGSADMTFSTSAPAGQRQQYRFSSALAERYQTPVDWYDLRRQLRLPPGNPQARQLAQQWARESASAKAFIEKVYQFFNREFTYTLEPPALGRDTIDEFLFQTQRGFCGHYSSATAFMLRAAGIPARIVTGYQGGEWNPYEQYLQVRQYDAHAWVEYWTQEQGWQRLDPTAFVAPERVEQPSSEAFKDEEQFLSDSPLLSTAITGNQLLANMRLQLEALNYGWHRWVLGYHNQQNDFLRSLLGAITPLRILMLLFVPFVIVIGLASFILLRSGGKALSHPCDQAISVLSKRLDKQGLQRQPGETVRHYFERLGQVRSELQPQLNELAACYEAIRYANLDLPTQQAQFNSLFKQLKQQL